MNASEGTVAGNIDNSFKSSKCKDEKGEENKARLKKVVYYKKVLLI